MRSQPKPAVRSKEERDKLVLQYQRLPYYIANRLYHRHSSVKALGLDDASQIGFMKLMRAAELWEEGKSAKFISYASRAIELGIFSEARQLESRASICSITTWDGKAFDYFPAKELPDLLLCGEALEAWKLLPRRSRYIVWKVVVDKWTYVKIAGEFRITKERVRQLYREALAWLEKKLSGDRPELLEYADPITKGADNG